uniref:Nuclease (SNase domain protein) n=1 Tax=Rhodopseudomonas palustris (strain BisA53) TaxID=316055 RepID=Q07VJ0_RHOP5
MHAIVIVLIMLFSAPGWAAGVVVKDARTLQLGGSIYRLHGIDAPDLDQTCINERADSWACGVEARDTLVKLIGDRAVACQDVGPDPAAKPRRIGICVIQGDTDSLSQRLVQDGLAVTIGEPNGRYAADEAAARQARKGLWRGCFVAPQKFRQWDINAPLLGASCRDDKKAELQSLLFPDEAVMPPGCPIKGKFAKRARVTGNVGVYHLQTCRGYASLTKPNRFFCSEDDAKAAGFRRAYNCRGSAKR